MRLRVLSVLAFAAAAAYPAALPPSADSILAEAKTQAQASRRAIFAIFGASW